MIVADDSTTKALQRLFRVVRKSEKPVVFWFGAGVGRWAGFPLWSELAARFHSEFLRAVNGYDAERGRLLLECHDYPKLFSLCRSLDRALYFRLLTAEFSPKATFSPVHNRFCQALEGIQPLQILTTNVDEALEAGLSGLQVTQRSDLDRAANALRSGDPFIGKLHGTISAAESMVFTKEDYDALLANANYLELIRLAFHQSAVVFIGYGLAEKYVLEALRSSDSTMKILGSGPHFLVTDRESRSDLFPETVQTIKYTPKPHQDHRSPLQVIDMIRSLKGGGGTSTSVISVLSPKTADESEEGETEPDPARSSYYLADFYPAGTWTTSQELDAEGPDGKSVNVLVGQGFDDQEIGKQPPRALHDLAVGLLCFDQTYLPLGTMSRLHDVLGSERFWHLHEEGALRFIHFPSTPAIIYSGRGVPAGGNLGMITRGFGSETRAWTVEEIIGAELRAMPGKEKEAAAYFESLKATTVSVKHEDEDLTATARAALLHPRLQSLIGLSDALPPTSVPRWLAYPSLRLLHVVQAADTCWRLGIPALKVPFGGEKLVSAVIGAGQSAYSADQVAGYLVLQRATGDLGSVLALDPRLFDGLIRFRATREAQQLRNEVFAALDVPEGAELEAAVNGGLRQAMPANVLDRARDRFEQLMVPRGVPARPSSPAVWADLAYADDLVRRWRLRARHRFEAYCADHGLGPYDPCPCGSQEKLRFCCAVALSD